MHENRIDEEGRLLVTDEPLQAEEPAPVHGRDTDTERAGGARDSGAQAGVESVTIYGDRLHVAFRKEGVVDEVAERLIAEGITVTSRRAIVPSLEDVFIALTKAPAEGGAGSKAPDG